MTVKKTWVLDEVLPPNSYSLVSTYNDSFLLEEKVIKVEPITCSIDDVKVETSSISSFLEDENAREDVICLANEYPVSQETVQTPDHSISMLSNECTDQQEVNKTFREVKKKRQCVQMCAGSSLLNQVTS